MGNNMISKCLIQLRKTACKILKRNSIYFPQNKAFRVTHAGRHE